MKYELEPYHRNVPDEAFLEDMRRVAGALGSKTVTMEEYGKHGTYHPTSITKRLGSWFKALERAGLEKARSEMGIPLEKCIADLKRAAQQLGQDTITQKQYREHGQYSPNTLIRRFGSWQAALEHNGLRKTRNFRVSEEEYFENLEYIWRTLGRQPRYTEIQKPLSRFSAGAYEQRFGTWRKALQAFVDYANTDTPENEGRGQIEKVDPSVPNEIHSSHPTANHRKSPRSISWRVRFLVMRRDNFKCKICGRSPATHPGLVLHVDHVEAWSKGGPTVMENLQTLCEEDNIGKSNLSMDAKEEG